MFSYKDVPTENTWIFELGDKNNVRFMLFLFMLYLVSGKKINSIKNTSLLLFSTDQLL